MPEYILEGTTGSPHNPEFVMTCKYKDITEEGRGKTKQEAKQSSAEKVFNKLQNAEMIVFPDIQISSYLENICQGASQLKILEEEELVKKSSTDKAINNYSELSKNQLQKHTKTNSYFNCHLFLKNQFDVSMRQSIIGDLQDIISVCENKMSAKDTKTLTLMIKNTLKSLEVELEEVDYQCNNFDNSYKSICCLKISTNPPICEIACGHNKREAKINGICEISKALCIFLI